MRNYEAERRRLIEEISRRGISDRRVLEAMLKVPRHLFVPEEYRDMAYVDTTLPIGEGQTISQPYIVALMTEALELDGSERVLEIGTGSGYQTAILAELADEVYTVERIPVLQERARKVLESLGYDNIHFKLGDGTCGWEEHAPYDAVIVTAGAPEIPKPLVEQLKVGGVMVIPVGDEHLQRLLKVRKLDEKGKLGVEDLGGCVFVKLKGLYGWR